MKGGGGGGEGTRVVRAGVLTRSEQAALLERVRQHGCARSRALLLEHNRGLVMRIVVKFTRDTHDMDDLAQEGMIALDRAIGKWDPAKGTLSTYATYIIRRQVVAYLERHPPGGALRLPGGHSGNYREARLAAERLRMQTGRTPEVHEVARAIGKGGKGMLRTVKTALSLELAGVRAAGLHENMAAPDALRRVRDEQRLGRRLELMPVLLGALTDQERTVVEARMGLIESGAGGGGRLPPMTLKEVSERMGCTKEWVRQVQAAALVKMRALAKVIEGE